MREARETVEPLLIAAVIVRRGAEEALAGMGTLHPAELGREIPGALHFQRIGRQRDEHHAGTCAEEVVAREMA